MPDEPTSYVYGPVPSRRLGRSLGIDLVPFKVCSYDCIYCQLGRTTNLTIERSTYTPVEPVLQELRARLAQGPTPDYIGLAGSGEPTLHAGIGDIIEGIKTITSVPVAVLTNGSLLYQAEVRQALAGADVVMPSLDAGDATRFQQVNRPHQAIDFDAMVGGLIDFTASFSGQVWLEVFLLDRLTGNRHEVGKVAEWTRRIQPDRVQLNSVARPAADDRARALSFEAMETLATMFDVPVDIARERPASGGATGEATTREALMALLGRRPCTVDGIAEGMALHHNEVIKHLASLREEGKVRESRQGGQVFFEAVRSGQSFRG